MWLSNAADFAEGVTNAACRGLEIPEDKQEVLMKIIENCVEGRHNDGLDAVLLMHKFIMGTMIEFKATLHGDGSGWEIDVRSKSMGAEMSYVFESEELIYHGAIKLKRVPTGIEQVVIGMLA